MSPLTRQGHISFNARTRTAADGCDVNSSTCVCVWGGGGAGAGPGSPGHWQTPSVAAACGLTTGSQDWEGHCTRHPPQIRACRPAPLTGLTPPPPHLVNALCAGGSVQGDAQVVCTVRGCCCGGTLTS